MIDQQAWDEFARDESALDIEKRRADERNARYLKHDEEAIEKMKRQGPASIELHTLKIYNAIAAELIKLGHDCVVDHFRFNTRMERDWREGKGDSDSHEVPHWYCPTLEIAGLLYSPIDIKEEYTGGGGWHSKPNGKISISIGNYGDRTRFPQRKDGSHNYAEIASIIDGMIKRKKTEERLEKQASKNNKVVEELSKELNISSYSTPMSIKNSMSEENPIIVKFEKAMTRDGVVKLHLMLVELGMVKK